MRVLNRRLYDHLVACIHHSTKLAYNFLFNGIFINFHPDLRFVWMFERISKSCFKCLLPSHHFEPETKSVSHSSYDFSLEWQTPSAPKHPTHFAPLLSTQAFSDEVFISIFVSLDRNWNYYEMDSCQFANGMLFSKYFSFSPLFIINQYQIY